MSELSFFGNYDVKETEKPIQTFPVYITSEYISDNEIQQSSYVYIIKKDNYKISGSTIEVNNIKYVNYRNRDDDTRSDMYVPLGMVANKENNESDVIMTNGRHTDQYLIYAHATYNENGIYSNEFKFDTSKEYTTYFNVCPNDIIVLEIIDTNYNFTYIPCDYCIYINGDNICNSYYDRFGGCFYYTDLIPDGDRYKELWSSGNMFINDSTTECLTAFTINPKNDVTYIKFKKFY